ncbi:MAG: N-6 DNA methylase [bacterium]|nr:N-6 DNA methylase [bacterium]
MSRGNHQFSSVKTEGGLLPQDILARIQSGDPELEGTKAETYHLGAHERIGEAANQAWSRLVSSWHAFQEALAKEPEDAPAIGLTRDRWLLPLFEILGYGRLPKGTATEVEGKSYAVSHTWHHSPIHLLGSRVDLDTRQKGVAGAATSSPHGLVQDFLNRSDAHLWGFVTNGYQLRVLRDHHSLTRQAYVEFDLQAIMDGEQYSEFLLLWLVCHQSRVEADKPEECWLETWVNISRVEGVRALDKLRDGVEKAIEAFGTGFLAHKANTRLKAALESGELDSQEYYRQILRLVYRLIFLFVAEERDALLDPNATEEARERYRRYYATRRIRDLADKRRGSAHGDLWRGIALVMEKLDDGYPELGLPALGSMLWGEEACPWLMYAECANEHVLRAVRLLSHIQDGKIRYPVNWRNVGADELGSIYEGLLELHPRMNKEGATFELDTAAGHERKTTGSYYTPTSLVDCLLDSSLSPILDEACRKSDPEAAVLQLKVCDPACGSGHFLVAAARRIAKRLASVRSGDDEASPVQVQNALRDVVGRCVHGVDLNPMAVELCKVSLWMEAIEPGKPLSFLDSHIQCGNALLGATPALVAGEIPDEAFKPMEGDDKDVAKRLTKRNRDERSGQATLFGGFAGDPTAAYGLVASRVAQVEAAADEDIEGVRQKKRLWDHLAQSSEYRESLFRADVWCAAFVWPKQPGDLENGAPTQDLWLKILQDTSAAPRVTRSTVRALARQYGFLHWHLAFPQVFGEPTAAGSGSDTSGWVGGFDLVIGNPPWDQIQFREQEFFASSAPEIANARSGAQRKKLIEKLKAEDAALFQDFQRAKAEVDGTRHISNVSGSFPNTGCGRMNTYGLFAERTKSILGPSGRAGLVLPSGIVTDDSTKAFFQELVDEGRLVSVFDFENRQKLFPDVDSRMKFCLLTMTGSERPVADGAEFVFFAQSVEDLDDTERRFRLSAEDIALLNPNTRTCPTFRDVRDARISLATHRLLGAFDSEANPSAESWNFKSKPGLFNMSHDSKLFRDAETAGNTIPLREYGHNEGSLQGWLPLIEAKMTGFFDHRAAGVVISKTAAIRQGQPSQLSAAEHERCDLVAAPRYWVRAEEVDKAISSAWDKRWLIGWKQVTSPTNHRTLIPVLTPLYGVGHSIYVALIEPSNGVPSGVSAAGLLACWSSYVCDYTVRCKLGGVNLTPFTIRQLPTISPSTLCVEPEFDSIDWGTWICQRVLELCYTAWDLESFAQDCGYSGPPFRWNEARRFLLSCELDAAFFHLYGIERDDVDHIMESFLIVKKKDETAHGDYRTKLQILEIYDRMRVAIESDDSYQTILDPPPADPNVAHPEDTRIDRVGAEA